MGDGRMLCCITESGFDWELCKELAFILLRLCFIVHFHRTFCGVRMEIKLSDYAVKFVWIFILPL